MSPWIKEAYDTGLLDPISLERGEFRLKETDFLVIIRKDAVVWQKKFIPNVRKSTGGEVVRSEKGDFTAAPSVLYNNTSFESIFENCPKHIQESLLYHLNIFNKDKSVPYVNIRGQSNHHISIDERQYYYDILLTPLGASK